MFKSCTGTAYQLDFVDSWYTRTSLLYTQYIICWRKRIVTFFLLKPHHVMFDPISFDLYNTQMLVNMELCCLTCKHILYKQKQTQELDKVASFTQYANILGDQIYVYLFNILSVVKL